MPISEMVSNANLVDSVEPTMLAVPLHDVRAIFISVCIPRAHSRHSSSEEKGKRVGRSIAEISERLRETKVKQPNRSSK